MLSFSGTKKWVKGKLGRRDPGGGVAAGGSKVASSYASEVGTVD